MRSIEEFHHDRRELDRLRRQHPAYRFGEAPCVCPECTRDDPGGSVCFYADARPGIGIQPMYVVKRSTAALEAALEDH